LVLVESTPPAALDSGAVSFALALAIGALGASRVAVLPAAVAPWADSFATVGASGVIPLMDDSLASAAVAAAVCVVGRVMSAAQRIGSAVARQMSTGGRVMSLASASGSAAHVVGSLGVRIVL
jgi:hypothetical protein